MKYKRYCPSTLDLKKYPHLTYVTKCWQTEDGVYDILFDEVGGFKQLRITRIDEAPVHNYMDLLEIKNDLWGKDVIAVEVYPKQSNLRNNRNTYHLWTWDGIVTPDLSKLYAKFYNK